MRKHFKKSLEWLIKNAFTVFSCVAIMVLGMGAIVYATTIGTNISTDGNLTVLSNSNLATTTISNGDLTVSGSLTLGQPLTIASGGTSASTAADARTALGLVFASTTDVQAPTSDLFAAWGDSLTAGDYPGYLSSILGSAVYNGGIGGELSTQIKDRMLAATDKYGYITIIWAGNNNPTDPTTVKSDIATMVAALSSPKRFVIISVDTNAASSYKGTSNYDTTMQLNADLQAAYPDNYLDVRSYLVSQYDPTISQDVLDHANDVPPSSLRSDNIHLTSTGYLKVAQQIANFIKQKYYVSSNHLLVQQNLIDLFASPYSIGSVNAAPGKFTNLSIVDSGLNSSPKYCLELTDAANWVSADWSGDYDVGFTHASAATTPLSRVVAGRQGMSIVGKKFQISFTILGRTAGSIGVSFGGVGANISYDSNRNYTFGPTALTADALTFTPSSDFNGTISNISVKEITDPATAPFTMFDNAGNGILEIRASSPLAGIPTPGNEFIGLGSGKYNTTGYGNTAVGTSALIFNTSGSGNTAVGKSALYFNGSGSFNVAVGSAALSSNTTGSSNTANGYFALSLNTTGNYNTAIGWESLYSNDSGYGNVGVGYYSMWANTTGYGNTGVGYNSLKSNSIGTNNVAIGSSALSANTSGMQNNSIGVQALNANTTGNYNVANGFSALKANTTGIQNIAVGVNALIANTAGNANVGIGYQSLGRNVSGNSNIAMGMNSLYSNVTGRNNTAVGYGALFRNTAATSSTAFGYMAGYGVPETYNEHNALFGFESGYYLSTGSYNTMVGSFSGFGDGTKVDQRSVVDTYMTFLGYQSSRDASVASTTALTNGTAIGKNAKVGASNSFILGGTGSDAVNVGIGTTTPATALDVNGIIKTQPRSTATCDTNSAGGIYFDSDDTHFYGCNGTAWVQLDNNP